MRVLGETERYQLLIDNAKIGWWDADLRGEYFVGSDFLRELIGMTSCKISFVDFELLIRDDYRNRIISEYRSVKTQDICEQIYPLQTRYGIKWVCSKLCRRSVDEEGNVVAYGYIQILPGQNLLENKCLNGKALLNDLLGHLGSISRALSSFVQANDPLQAIENVLKEVLDSMDINGRAYIVEYCYEKNCQNRTYEICSKGVDPVLHISQNLSLESLSWSVSQIVASHPILINVLKDIPCEAVEEIDLLKRQGVVSAIMIPMGVGEKISGFMGIEIVDIPRLWSDQDYHWLSSVANIFWIVTEMAKARMTLNHSEELFRNIYTNIPVGIELYDKKGNLIDINDKDVQMFGLPSREFVLEKGFNVFENPFVSADVLSKLHQMEPVSYRRNYDFDKIQNYYKVTKSGYLDISTNVKLLYNSQGEFTNYIFINIDNTDTMIAHNRIEEFETFFSIISEFAKVGYARINLDTGDGFASNQWYRNVGEEEGTPLPDIVGLYSNVHPEDSHIVIDFLNDVRAGKADGIRREFRVRQGDTWKWTRTNIMRNIQSAVKNEVISINYDISELKETQQLRDKAEELDRLKSAFLANMSHEIRTPLNAIVGFSTLLADTESHEEQQQFINIIQKNNDLLLQLISDILDLAKIEAGTIDYKPVDIDLQDLLNELVVSMRIKISDQVRLCCSPGLEPCVFCSDRVRLTQVISNFVNNAIKYTAEGAIILSYELRPDEIMFSVQDTGIGMPLAVQEQVFNRFYKANSFKQGTGLGLYICKSIVEELGGKIGVRSEVGQGACFWFTLPRE